MSFLINKSIEIAGIPIDDVDMDDVLGWVDRMVHSDHQAQLVTVNPEMILMASQDSSFCELLRIASLRTPDGIGILWAAYYLEMARPASSIVSFFQWFFSLFAILFSPRLIRNPLRERVTGTDLLARIAEASQTRDWTLFLLGAKEGIAEQTIGRLSAIFPCAKFIGSFSGSPQVSDDTEAIRKINLANPSILFVAFGSPAQEQWIQRNLSLLPSVRVAMGVGGAFDFHAGKIPRAPLWMQKTGLEWLWRLFREPRRLKRIWNAAVRFPIMIYIQKRNRKTPRN